MQCYVYKGERKKDYYLYLEREFDQDALPVNFPRAVLTLMGELSFVIEFDLNSDRKLAQAETEQVMADIKAQGYYLQMPKKDMDALEDEYFS